MSNVTDMSDFSFNKMFRERVSYPHMEGKTYILCVSIWPMNIHGYDRKSGEDHCLPNKTEHSKITAITIRQSSNSNPVTFASYIMQDESFNSFICKN